MQNDFSIPPLFIYNHLFLRRAGISSSKSVTMEGHLNAISALRWGGGGENLNEPIFKRSNAGGGGGMGGARGDV